MKVGILALQGAVGPHVEKLASLGVEPIEVRTPAELATVQGIILPGGESTTMLRLLHLNKLWDPLRAFVRERPAWGVCAGAILLAKEVRHPEQASLGAIDIRVERNAFGRQVASFIAPLESKPGWVERHLRGLNRPPYPEVERHLRGLNRPPYPEKGETVQGVFIRAPRITAVGSGAEVLLTYKGEPVMVESGHTMATTFHPELTASAKIHDYFLQKCDKTIRHG